MTPWRLDADLFALVERDLFTGVVGDVLDKLGFQQQVLPPYLRPLSDDTVQVGRAMPVLEVDVFGTGHTPPARQTPQPHARDPRQLKSQRGLRLRGLGPHLAYALRGELMSTRALQLGGAGAVLGGYARDTRGIFRLGFPGLLQSAVRAAIRSGVSTAKAFEKLEVI